MKRNYLSMAGIIGITLFAASCTKEPLNHITPEESRIYITDYDSSVNFSSFKTYSISDSVAVISNSANPKERSATDEAYINAVKKYMAAGGYQLVSKDQSPDIGINVSRIYSTSTGIVSYNNYYNYWDPFYWGYSGYSYYVPYSYGVYQVTEGLVSIDMFDLKDAASSGKINLIWNGLVRGEGIFSTVNADAGVQALFSQSPYLQTAQ